uniref:Uncharacterized protein n=1 Tax=Rhizophora mucronata TaxID=61149 RepID=A0A2P2PTU4_RHIMU
MPKWHPWLNQQLHMILLPIGTQAPLGVSREMK